MITKIIKDVLSEDEISSVLASVQHEIDSRPILKEDKPTSTTHPDDAVLYWKDFGRIDVRHPKMSQEIIDKVFAVVKENVDDTFSDLKFQFVIYAEYSTMAGGNPMLNPHWDVSDTSTIILDYQIESNVSWPIKVESQEFQLDDNSALLFDSVENIHYRPVRDFIDGEFVKMLFFRFSSSKKLNEKTQDDSLRLYYLEVDHDPSKDIGKG